jgi:hypothetical protein
MADVSITASQVAAGDDAEYYDGTAGETTTAGMPCYLATSDNTLYKADADTKSKAQVKGLALHGASAGQPLRVQTGGEIILGAAAAPPAGTVYWLSQTAGGIAPFVDLDAGAMYGTYLGIGNSVATGLLLHIHATDQLLAAFDSSP